MFIILFSEVPGQVEDSEEALSPVTLSFPFIFVVRKN